MLLDISIGDSESTEGFRRLRRKSPFRDCLGLSPSLIMWCLRRAAHPFKKQGYCLEASRIFGSKSNTSSNVRGDGDSICCPAQLISPKLLSVKLFHLTPVLDRIFVGSHSLCSRADECSGGKTPVEDKFVEPETTATVDVIVGSNAGEEGGEVLDSETVFLDDDFSDTEKGEGGEASQKKAYLELCKAIMDSPSKSVAGILDKWVEEGNDLEQLWISGVIISLRRRGMYTKALQFSEWLETTKQVAFTERDYAARLDLIVKVKGIQMAEKYIERIPTLFKGELVYRTLLAGFVHFVDKNKAETVFEKIRELELPITVFAFNQMIILYKRLDKRKVADVLSLMEKENVKPSLLTYKLLIDIKGESGDIVVMEQLFETMKAEGVLPDIHVLTVLAKHYISGGLKHKAQNVLKEIGEEKLKGSLGAHTALLGLYASLDNSDEVARIWKECELDPRMSECIAAIEAWGKLGKVEEAEAVFEIMLQKWKRLSSMQYCALLKVYVDQKLVTKGKEFVKRMEDCVCWVSPSACDALVRLFLIAGELEKADSILHKATQQNRERASFRTYIVVLEEYAKRGDVHNAEKLFHRMKQCGYTSRLKPFDILIRAYINAKVPAYGFLERMKAENIFPNKAFTLQLAQADPFRKNRALDLLDL